MTTHIAQTVVLRFVFTISPLVSQTTTHFDPTNPLTWIGSGALGATVAFILFMFSRGWFVPGFIYKREVERGDRYEQALQQTTPVLMKSNALMESVFDLLKEFKTDRDARITQLLEEVERGRRPTRRT